MQEMRYWYYYEISSTDINPANSIYYDTKFAFVGNTELSAANFEFKEFTILQVSKGIEEAEQLWEIRYMLV